MALKNILLTKADFDALPWCDVITECIEKECEAYYSKFYAKAKEAGEAKNEKVQEIYTLLGAICSFHFKPENKEPFGPMLVMNTGRSAIVDDIIDDYIQVLLELLPHVEDPEMRARIADIIWLRKRDYKAAEVAIEAYLESASVLENPESWVAGFERIHRAFRLSVCLGKQTSYWKKVISHIESILDKYDGKDSLYLSARLMELLLELQQGDSQKYSTLSEKIAIHAEQTGDYHRAKTYWEIKARWDALSGSKENETEAKICVAETYVKNAEQANSSMVASTWMGKAIEEYRRIGGQKTRIDELHRRMIEIQKGVSNEMKAISHEIDISEMVERYRSHISGRKLHDALFEFCVMASPPNVERLGKRVDELVKNYPLQYLINKDIVNEKGKVIGKRPSMMTDDPEEVAKAKIAEMYSQAQFERSLIVQGLIEPVRHQINIEHRVQIRDFISIVQSSPFVPQGRELIFAKGLYAGVIEEYLDAIHLLMPQVENSIRHILEQKGVTVSKFNDEGIQDEKSQNELLYCDKVEEIFGQDLSFDLRGLLVERTGANLRNRVAHGLISLNGFYSIEVSYFWWLTLRLCCLPLIMQIMENQQKPSSETNEGKGQ